MLARLLPTIAIRAIGLTLLCAAGVGCGSNTAPGIAAAQAIPGQSTDGRIDAPTARTRQRVMLAMAEPPASTGASDLSVQEADIEAQIKRVHASTTLLQNELDQQVMAPAAEMERDLGRSYVNMNSHWSGYEMQLDALLKVKVEIAREMAGVHAELGVLEEQRKEGAATPEFDRQVRANPRCMALQQRLDTLEIKVGMAEKVPSPDKAKILLLKQEQDLVQHKLSTMVVELRASLQDAAHQKLTTRLQAMSANAGVVNETVSGLAQELGKLNQMTAEYARLQQRERVMRERIKVLEDERYRLLDSLDAVRRRRAATAPSL
jgi:hypothetical protein